MKIDTSYNLRDLLFEKIGSKRNKSASVLSSTKNRSEDYIELSGEGTELAKKGQAYLLEMKNKLETGEPLGDISYEEYLSLKVAIMNSIGHASIEEWEQAKKGWKATVSNRLWVRKSIAYASEKVVNTNAFKKDYQRYLEIYAKGGNLTEHERSAMIIGSAYLSKFGEDYINAAKERQLSVNGQKLEDKFSEAGVKLDKSEKLTITIHGFKPRAEGIEDAEKLATIQKVLDSLSYDEISSLTNSYDNKKEVPNYFANSTNKDRRLSAEIGIAEYVLKRYGIKNSLSELHIEEDGTISGLTDQLKEIFENNRVREVRDETESKYTLEEMKVFEMKKCMYDAVKAVESRGYENIKRYDYKFEYNNGSIKLIDL